MFAAAERELAAAGLSETPGIAIADAGYWNHIQLRNIINRGTQVLVPPDGSNRKGHRPGCESGAYERMRLSARDRAPHRAIATPADEPTSAAILTGAGRLQPRSHELRDTLPGDAARVMRAGRRSAARPIREVRSASVGSVAFPVSCSIVVTPGVIGSPRSASRGDRHDRPREGSRPAPYVLDVDLTGDYLVSQRPRAVRRERGDP